MPARTRVITDENVSRSIQIPSEFPQLVLPAGESTKSFEAYRAVIDWLSHQGTKRNGQIVAVGGGVIGDLAGFAAATYMRGIDLIMVPTSLLAMVDSSVGGKVAIDLPSGKNLVGSFWPPAEVRICIDFLKTLPPAQVTNGIAEVLKYGFITRPGLLNRLIRWLQAMSYEDVVAECIDCKAEVVEADERETTGQRAILNFGHTIGHAIESFLGYQGLLHGEAISIGMAVESQIAVNLKLAEAPCADEIAVTLRQFGLPIWHSSLGHPDVLIPFMKLDKKADDAINMSLVPEMGHCQLVKGISPELISESLLQVFKKKAS